MSELTDDQKRSIEKNVQNDLTRDNQAGTESQRTTFHERIGGLKDAVIKKASDLEESVSEKVSELKDFTQDTASNLDRKKAAFMIAAGIAVAGVNVTDRIEMNTHQYETNTQIATHYRGDSQVHIEAPQEHTEAPGIPPGMPPIADMEVADATKKVNEGVEPGQGSQTETGQPYTGPGQETYRQIVLNDGTIAKIVFPEEKRE